MSPEQFNEWVRLPGNMQRWQAWLNQMAVFPNVNAKFSGLTAHPLATRIAAIAFASFGLERLMFGSDWPIATVSGEYQQNLEALQLLFPTTNTEFWGRTAERVYRLGGQPLVPPIHQARSSEAF